MKDSLSLLLATLGFALATNDTNSSSDGLDGGAIAGIVIGSLAGVAAIGAGVWYFFLKEGAMYGSGGGSAAGAGGAAAVGSKLGANHLPMVALKVSGDDSL